MTDGVPPGARCTVEGCEAEGVDPDHPAPRCPEHHPAHSNDDRDINEDNGSTTTLTGDDDLPTLQPGQQKSADSPRPSSRTGRDRDTRLRRVSAADRERVFGDDVRWDGVEWANPETDTYPSELVEREQWMGHSEKKPFAPWADEDHPEAGADEDARWKWGLEDNYVDGETVAMAEVDPRLDGRAFLQQPDDPYAYVDGDDVRDPETGKVHPAFVAVLEHLGVTYADVSQSGAGVHAIYRGELPDGVKQASWQLDDDPWGSNEDLPSIELYPGKRVCVMTGDHVPGTPTEIQEWNDDVVDALLEANDEVATSQREDQDPPSTDREDYDLADYDPDATTSTESTGDIRDVFAALDRLDAERVAERTIVASWNDDASTSDGERAFRPTWGRNSNGTANIANDKRWQDTGDRAGYGGPVVMALIDAGEMRPERASPRRATGELWWRGVEHLRELGFDIPEYTPSRDGDDRGEQRAVLPDNPALNTATSGWDWRNAGADTDLSIDAARQRTTEAIADAYDSNDQVLVEALPTMGKSYGAVAAAAETGEEVTILTGRGRKEQYAQFKQWCDEHGLDYYTLPAFTRDCDTANGEHGQDWAERVKDWYRRGATPKMIHKAAEYALGEPLPCQRHDGHSCPYASKWDFDPDDYDVLIGHYSHAYKSKVTSGRTVVVDEFPASYETTFDPLLEPAVSYWLDQAEEIPFEDYTDLIEHRDDQSRRGEALLWFEDHDVEPDEAQVFDDAQAHAHAPLAVYALLASEDLGNGFERAALDDHGHSVFDRSRSQLHLLHPPAMDYASGIVALDGTPTKRMWELCLGTRLNHREVLQPEERAEYIEDVLDLNLVRTTNAVKPYNPQPDRVDDRIALEKDAALLEAIRDQHGQRPSLITTARAEGYYDEQGVLELVDETKHYGNVLGSNEFKTTRLGAVIGSNHYGDGFIKKWGAYAGEAVERNGEKGSGLSYGGFGDRILTHMREHDTLQAAMRFGRDGNGAVVYVHTDTLPDWVPLAGEGRVLQTWSDGMRQVLDVIQERREWTTAEIAAHPDVDIGERQVRNHLATLAEEHGAVEREVDGCGYVWRPDGLHRVSEHGDVDLDPVEFDELTAEESAELARSSIYTWSFRRSPADPSQTPPDHSRDNRGGSSAEVEGG